MNREVLLTDFKIEDLDKVNVGYDVGEDVEEFKERLKEIISVGESKSIIYEGVNIAIMGYHQLWPGVCELWVFPQEVIKHKGVLALILRDGLNKLLLTENFHRLQATVKKNDPSEAFLVKLGFKEEGVLEQYSTLKQDYKMWARIYNGN